MSIVSWLGQQAARTGAQEGAKAGVGAATGSEEASNFLNLAGGPLGALSYALTPKTAYASELDHDDFDYVPNAEGFFTEVPKGSNPPGVGVQPSAPPPPAPPPTPVPQQIGQGSAASPAATPMNQQPNQAAQEGQLQISQGLLSQGSTAPQLPAGTVAGGPNAPGPSTSLGGGSLGGAAAAFVLPNPFLHTGSAQAGFAPELGGLLPSSLGSTAVAATEEEVAAHQDERRDFTPGRHYESAGPIASRLGFGGWQTEEAEDVAERVNQSYAGEAQRQGVPQTQYATVIDDTPVYVASATDPNDDDDWDPYEGAATGVDEVLNRRTYSRDAVLEQARQGNARTGSRDSLAQQAEANRIIEQQNEDDSSSGGK